jgi:hypothetical protein
MNLQEQIRKVLREFILIETEGADPNNPDSHPDLDDWGSDSWWTFEDWKTWYNANLPHKKKSRNKKINLLFLYQEFRTLKITKPKQRYLLMDLEKNIL